MGLQGCAVFVLGAALQLEGQRSTQENKSIALTLESSSVSQWLTRRGLAGPGTEVPLSLLPATDGAVQNKSHGPHRPQYRLCLPVSEQVTASILFLFQTLVQCPTAISPVRGSQEPGILLRQQWGLLGVGLGWTPGTSSQLKPDSLSTLKTDKPRPSAWPHAGQQWLS